MKDKEYTFQAAQGPTSVLCEALRRTLEQSVRLKFAAAVKLWRLNGMEEYIGTQCRQESLPLRGDMKSLTTTTTSANSCASVPVVKNHPSSDSVLTCIASRPFSSPCQCNNLLVWGVQL